MTKNVLYYHIYLTDDNAAWSTIFLEQMKCAEDYGLLNYLDRIEVTCISPKDDRIDQFLNLCGTYPVTFNVDLVNNHHKNDYDNMSKLNDSSTISENYTYRKIYRDCQNTDMNVFYLHCKGITSYIRMLKYGNDPGAEEFKRYYYWRQFLNWGAIQHWKTHVRALKHYDVSGVNFQEYPSPHYSGAFWWSKSKWIRTLPDPVTIDWWNKIKKNSTDNWFRTAPDRYKDEHWIAFKKETKVFNLIYNEINPFYTLMTTDKYSSCAI